ncbi:hypothetical protein SHJJP8905_000201 [Staphylococcus lugdunensis]|uniref:hypothetical protein n=1 Tax=Staphylococcus lugdunensis TaxID=28035 RepID=UPI00024E4A97|nr:hypothetical protein [Staphylococcus lugdunensis]ARJ17030.1 hypothetical protein B6N54_10555 [Staphylococcus lugdunensis]EHS02861.1 hypothetical protein SEVCU139_1156 [Staphylococcus lugdunensis VCU139]MCH8652691.1 hypothetical protein [Staphylococcus lugdunensis]MCH8657816.1 hypothetical protein [Staphylococcus lugdunensis]MCH8668120.1 hypothetical protein [Staphylococcus lugdunensis]
MQEQIKNLVLNGNFDAVRELMSEADYLEFEEAYISSAHEVESMMFYTCILDMIKDEETAELHDLAFLLLVYPLSEAEGALNSAYYHAQASIQLTEGKEVKSLLQMLLLHAIPEPVISDAKALKVAKQILKLDPSNSVARNILKETAKRMDNVVVDFNELNRYKDVHS